MPLDLAVRMKMSHQKCWTSLMLKWRRMMSSRLQSFAKSFRNSSALTSQTAKWKGWDRSSGGCKPARSTANSYARWTAPSDWSSAWNVWKTMSSLMMWSSLMNVPSIWKSMQNFASITGGNSRSWKDVQSIPSRYTSGPTSQKEERLELLSSQGTWIQHFTWTKSWKKHFCPSSTRAFLMVIASSKTTTLSTQAVWPKTSWLGAESTGGRHLQKAQT